MHRIDGAFICVRNEQYRPICTFSATKDRDGVVVLDCCCYSSSSRRRSTISSRRSLSSLSKRAATQPVDFPLQNRWMAVPPANLVRLSIGGVNVDSMWTPVMTQALGVVSSAPLDWTHSQVLPVISCATISLGLTTHFLGSWVEFSSSRRAGTVGSLFWSL